jgi:hypothetical protein
MPAIAYPGCWVSGLYPAALPVPSLGPADQRLTPPTDRARKLQVPTALTELRNEELHSSAATLANAGEAVWMPNFLNVTEAICGHLSP